ncbi:MAG: CARDB domain-containing protein, partial [Pirellulales bacterium]
QQLVLQIIPRKSRPFQLAIQSTFRPESSQTVVEVQEPKLQITVSGPDEMLFGGTESYKITVSNPGTGDAENVVVSTASTGQSSEGSGRVALGILPAGEHKVLNLRLTATEAGTMQLKAVAAADGGLAADVVERVLIRRAGLEIEADGPKMKYSGSAATYHVRVTNPGNATAENIKVEVALPPGAKYHAATAGGMLAPDGGKVNWNIPSLRAGAEQAFDVQCTLQAAGENRVQLTAAADGRISDTASFVTAVEALADLKLEVTDPQGPVGVGEDMVYEIRIRNRGSKSAEGIALVTYFSEGVEPIQVAGGAHRVDVGQVTFEPFRVLEAGDEIVCKITAKASAAGNHVFRAEVTCKNPETRLVGEETTRFYGDSASKTAKPATREPAATGSDASE